MRKVLITALVICGCMLAGASSAYADFFTEQTVPGSAAFYPITIVFDTPNDGDGGNITGSISIIINGLGPTISFTPNITYPHSGLSIVDVHNVDLVNGYAETTWTAPGSTATNYLKARAKTNRYLFVSNTGEGHVEGGHSNPVPEIPVGGAVPMVLLLGAGIYYLRKRRAVAI